MIDVWSILGGWAAKKGLDQLYSRIVTWFKKTEARGVLVIGPGGVGKTTLGCLLSADNSNELTSYEESVSTEEFRLNDDTAVQIIIPPGQAHRRTATWANLLEDVAAGKFRGIVVIFAYGHHALGDISYKNHRLYDPEKGHDTFVSQYIEDCLKAEEKVLKTICEAVRACSAPIWVLTLVTKEDLWWNERDDVDRHYSEGKYGKVIRECLGGKSERMFRHERVLTSLVIKNLTTGKGEVLKQTVAGYDSEQQEKSFENLLRVFEGLMRWENEHGK